ISESLQSFAGSTTTLRSQPDLLASDTVPSSWVEWLSRLRRAERWPAAVAAAEAGAREWRVETIAADERLVSATADLLLAERPTWAQTALRDALPFFLTFFLESGPDARLRAIYENLFMVLAVDEHVSLAQVAALIRVAEARLVIGVSSAEYRELVTQLKLTL